MSKERAGSTLGASAKHGCCKYLGHSPHRAECTLVRPRRRQRRLFGLIHVPLFITNSKHRYHDGGRREFGSGPAALENLENSDGPLSFAWNLLRHREPMMRYTKCSVSIQFCRGMVRCSQTASNERPISTFRAFRRAFMRPENMSQCALGCFRSWGIVYSIPQAHILVSLGRRGT